ncbi:MAG: tetratricopeptide repeat protein [Caulobacteraceae bacterium]
MNTPAALIAQGLQHHRANRLDEAKRLYLQAQALAPSDAQAPHLLGVLAQQGGDFAGSLILIERAIALSPAAHHFTNLANAYNHLGRHAEAEAAAAEALRRDPASWAALSNRGVAQRGLKAYPAAETSFRGVLALKPDHADAYSNLGVVLTELGRLDEAVTVLERAVALNPASAEAWLNLGNARLRLLAWTPAGEAFRRAIALQPDYSDAYANLGATQKALGQRAEAVESYAAAARLNPGSALAQHNLGLILGDARRFDESVAVLDKALGLDPGSAAMWVDFGNALYEQARTRNDVSALPIYDLAAGAHRKALELQPELVAAHYNLGLVLLDRGELEGAVAAFRAAIALRPDYAEGYCNLGHCLSELGRLDEAVAACEHALKIKPTLAEAQSTLGNIFIGRGRLEEAEVAYRAAVLLKPDLAGGYCNLGVSLLRQGRSQAALEALDHALALNPDNPDAHWNRALVLLQRGDYAEGWDEYEWRLNRSRRIREDIKFTQPLWTGEPLDGAKILLHTEQGLGDAIQCARFIPHVVPFGGEIVLQAPRSLTSLFAAIPGVSQIIVDGETPPPVACRLPLFSLPRLFAPAPEAVPTPIPYLAIPPERTVLWADRLSGIGAGKLRVGVVWSGNVTSEAELGRSIPLSALTPLAAAGVALISLQKGYGVDQLDTAPMPITRLGPDYDAGDFADTAGVIQALDLIISCDTSVAHLAGALGCPVWMAVNAVADWRWLEGRTDTVWYPTLRLYRQPTPGDWSAVFEHMAADLPAFMHNTAARRG